ncbi:MAG: amidohydrolase [Bacillota bacterium]
MRVEEIKERAQALAPDLVAWRRHLHAHPELSFQETETSRYIQEHLRRFGIPFTLPAGTAVVGVIEGRRPGRTVAIRADIDALPIEEENTFPFRSTRPGVMHACGHDGHTAILLGVARLLAESPDFPGRVKLIFQHAEETPPGGAQALVAAGVLADVDHVIGLHLISSIPTGKAAILTGPQMASADNFTARIVGQGGHGASPHEAVDSIVAAAAAVMNLQTVVSRRVDPLLPAVVTVGQLHAGTAANVIAPVAVLEGTIRALDEETRRLLHAEVRRILEATAGAYGARAEVEIAGGYPPLVNHPHEAEVFRAVCREALGPDWNHPIRPFMGGEDFAYYLRERPGAFLFLGCRNEAKGACWPHHHPRFTIDEDALPLGVEILIRAALRLLTAGAEG